MLLIIFYCHYAPIWCYFRTNSATIQKYNFIFCNNDSEPGEEDLDDNDADANVNNIRPRPDRWHPAGAAVCQSCFFNTFTHWYSIIGRSLCFWKWGIPVTCFNNIISNRKWAFKYCIFITSVISFFITEVSQKGEWKVQFFIYTVFDWIQRNNKTHFLKCLFFWGFFFHWKSFHGAEHCPREFLLLSHPEAMFSHLSLQLNVAWR